MPIQGLTDVPKAFLRLGNIRKGEKDPNTGFPRDLDYFRVTFHPSEAEVAQEFARIYGPKPTSINIRLAFPDIKDVWDANYECYAKGGMIAKAASSEEKGLYWIFYRDHATGEVLVRNGQPTTPEAIEFTQKPILLEAPIYTYTNKKGEVVPVCLEPIGRLNVVVPEISHLRVGFLEMRPTSPKDISAISRELAAIDHMAKLAGKDITGIPMRLMRREEQITKNINGNLSRGASWLVHIEVGGEWGGKALEVIERRALPEYIEAEVEELPDEPPEDHEPKDQDPIKAELSDSQRPYLPDTFKTKFEEGVQIFENNAKESGKPVQVEDKYRNVIAAALNKILGNDESRKEFLLWLTGKESTKDLSPSQIKTLMSVMSVYQFNQPPKEESVIEIKACHGRSLFQS